MAALLVAFTACLLAGMGGRGQLLAILLHERFGARRTVAGVAVAAIVAASVAAAIGHALGQIMPTPARVLLLALALLSAGGSMLGTARPPADPGAKGGVFTVAVTMLALGLGDRGQFLVSAAAAAFPHPVLAAVGGAIGGFAALALPLAAGPDTARAWMRGPMRTVSRALGAIFLLAGAAAALSPLGLV